MNSGRFMRAVKAAIQLKPRFSSRSVFVSLSFLSFLFFFFHFFSPSPLSNHRAFRCVGRASELERRRVRFDALVN